MSITYYDNRGIVPGVYNATAVVSQANYYDLTLNATLTITNANITGVEFRYKQVQYDGNIHSLAVIGLTPDMEVTYTNHSHINAGIYEATALITRPYHNALTLYAVLRIEALEFTGITLSPKIVTYDTLAHTPDVNGLPSGATVEYLGNPVINFGTYQVTALISKPNYRTLTLSSTVTITKANAYIEFEDKSKVYGENDPAIEFAVSGMYPQDTLSGAPSRQAGQNVAQYAYTLGTLNNPNYNLIASESYLTITKAQLVITADTVQTHSYTGSIIQVSATLNFPEATLIYSPQQGYVDNGVYEITISTANNNNFYADSLMVTLVIEKADFEAEFTNYVVAYNGSEHTILATNIVEGATVTYHNNKGTNVGVYNASVLIEKANYNTVILEAQLIIEKADIEGVVFEDLVTAYTGDTQFLTADNLPDNATVTYNNNEGTLPGIYAASVTISKANYNTLTLYAQLIIRKATITGVEFNDMTVNYTGEEFELVAAYVPQAASVVYTNNKGTEIGIYNATLTISMENYFDLVLQATLTITKGVFDVIFEDKTVGYDGNPHSLEVLNMPLNTSVVYSDENLVNASLYVISATLTNPKYDTVVLYAELEILPVALTVNFDDYEGLVYNGQEQNITVWLDGVVAGDSVDFTVSYDDDPIGAGSYTATVSITDTNYTLLNDYIVFDIDKATPIITVNDLVVDYDGEPKQVIALLSIEGDLTYSYNGSPDLPIEIGIYEVIIAYAGSDNYYAVEEVVTLTIQ